MKSNWDMLYGTFLLCWFFFFIFVIIIFPLVANPFPLYFSKIGGLSLIFMVGLRRYTLASWALSAVKKGRDTLLLCSHAHNDTLLITTGSARFWVVFIKTSDYLRFQANDFFSYLSNLLQAKKKRKKMLCSN